MKSWTGGALLTATSILWLTPAAFAQITSIPVSTIPQYPNTVGFGVSYGPFLDRDADFWGLAVDYGRRLQDGWSIGASLAFDRETDRSKETIKRTDTLSTVAVINYSFRRLTLTTGLSKGFADTDHPDGDWHFVNGDWGTGIIIGTAIPGLLSSKRMSVSFSAGYEYNLTEREPDLSFDVGVGYAF